MRATVLFLLAAPALLVGCTGAEDGPGPAASPASRARLDPNRPLPSPLPDIVARVNGEAIPLHRILPMARGELETMPEEARDAGRAGAVRRALERYIDRELLFQEAIARDVPVDPRAVNWAYDQARASVPDEAAWGRVLAEQGLDEKSFRMELRVQETVKALLEREERGPLLERLRAGARIETYL